MGNTVIGLVHFVINFELAESGSGNKIQVKFLFKADFKIMYKTCVPTLN